MSKSIVIIVLSAFGILWLSAWGNFPTPPLTLEDDSNNGTQKVPQHLSNVIFISGTDDVKSDPISPIIAYAMSHVYMLALNMGKWGFQSTSRAITPQTCSA